MTGKSTNLAYRMDEEVSSEVQQDRAQAVMVLGMHRSGTSLVMRLCNLLGVDLGDNLLPPQDDNVTGFWEHAGVIEVHDAILEALGSGWDDITPLPENWTKKPEIQSLKAQLKNLVRQDFSGIPLWGIKDPRLVRLIDVWMEILEELSIEPVFIIPVRNPYDVAESLRKREFFPPHKSLLMWLEHLMLAEVATRQQKRVFVSYEGMLNDWQEEVARITQATGIVWPVSLVEAEKEIASFIRPDLQHNKQTQYPGLSFPHIESWVKQGKLAEQAFLAGNEADGRMQMDQLAKDFYQKIDPVQEVLETCYADRKVVYGRMVQAYTDLHYRNLHEDERIVKLQHELAEERKRFLHANSEIGRLHAEMRAVFASRSWRITKPLRAGTQILRLVKSLSNKQAFQRIMKLIRTHGVHRLVTETFYLVKDHGISGAIRYYKAKVGQEIDYNRWIAENDTLTDEDRERIRNHIQTFAAKPLISIVMPVYNIEERWLRDAIDSVLIQLYPNWELCIADDCSPAPHIRKVLDEYKARDSRIKVVYRPKNGHISEASNSALELASGEYIALLDHDDTLAEHALYHVVCAINQHPDADLFYSDEDKINAEGHRFGPYFKTDWNPDLFYTQNMFCHLGVYRRSIVEKIGRFRKGYEGSQDYDLALRAIQQTDSTKICHIPRILYHWRAIEGSTALNLKSKNYAVSASRRAVADYFATAYPEMAVKIVDSHGVAKHKGYHRVVWPIPDPAPKVTLLIPTRNAYKLVRTCVESILAKTTYPNYEVVILNNQSDDPETLAYFASLKEQGKATILDYNEPFNFSAVNNFGVAHTDGDIIGLINNDIEVITPGWLEEMVGHALRPEIGAVGAKLYYPDDTIQHGGVILGVGVCDMPIAGHAFYHLPKNDPGYYARAILTQGFSAVTAACLLVRRDVFEEVNGLEEERLTVAFNDVDFCLKIQEKGYRNLWTPYAELYHHESATRGYEDTPEKMQRFRQEQEYMRGRWGDVLDNDPYYNPNLNIYRGDFSLAEASRVKNPWETN